MLAGGVAAGAFGSVLGLGGGLLIVLGVVALWGVASGRVYGHSHRHSGEPAAHWHLHVGSPDRHPAPASHSHLPTLIGAAFAISSLRALTLLAPFGSNADGASLGSLLILVAPFLRYLIGLVHQRTGRTMRRGHTLRGPELQKLWTVTCGANREAALPAA